MNRCLCTINDSLSKNAKFDFQSQLKNYQNHLNLSDFFQRKVIDFETSFAKSNLSKDYLLPKSLSLGEQHLLLIFLIT